MANIILLLFEGTIRIRVLLWHRQEVESHRIVYNSNCGEVLTVNVPEQTIEKLTTSFHYPVYGSKIVAICSSV